ncbi:hypothetical protein LOD99_5865 [Oopsacas minuta]|uniref:DUF3719 domain-containing protein n=1 Tax=Oopsacas minuta TaxID=111878 RepID=A0AAV7JNA0_9METZ|nr:hypothetical protein LOD99_5865 [Oopsacas minuta]
MPATRSNPNAVKLPVNLTIPHPDLQESGSYKTNSITPFDEDVSFTDTEHYTSSIPEATGLSIFSDFLHGRLQGHERDWGSSNLDTTISGDSSFAFSWGGVESEFEQNATKKVLQLYENIQCHLYQNSDLNANLIQENLITECKVWRKYFPHLRVVGHQILPSTEDFIQLIETDRATPYETSTIYPEINMLQLIGSCVNCYVSPLSEEILHQVGVYEEYFAFDSSPRSPDDKNSKPVKKRSKLPPVSPNSCIKEAILETVFEQLWEDLAPLMEPLIEFCRTNRHSQLIASIQSSRTSSGIRPQLPALYNAFPSLQPVFQENSQLYTNSILPIPLNNLQLQKPNPFNTASSLLKHSDYNTLRNAIPIRPFPLQSRGSVTTNPVPELPPDPRLDLQYILSPPTTAGTGYNTVKPFQYQQAKPFQRNSDASTGTLAQHRPRTQGRKGQLKPLQDNNKNSNNTTGILGPETNYTGPTGQLESVLIGHKIVLDRFSTPGSQTRSPIPWSKPSKQLPPIDTDETYQPSSPMKQRTTKVSFSSRVSSADLNSTKERKFGQIPKILDVNRPQTIHDVRPDPNQLRISSPLTTKRDIHQKNSTPLSPISLRVSGIRNNNVKTGNYAKVTTNKQFQLSNLENNGILGSISGVFFDEQSLKQNYTFTKTGTERNKIKTVASIRGTSL